MTNLEKNKQYLEQLRQLALIRHQKKQFEASNIQSSIKSKKNKTALSSVQSEQASPSVKMS